MTKTNGRSSPSGGTYLSQRKTLEALARPGAFMAFMHDRSSPSGKTYCVIPGGRVALDVAEAIIKRDDVVSGRDGLLPDHEQTWSFLR